MFHLSKDKEAYLPLFAGLILAPAVVTLSLSTKLQQPDYFIYFPIPALLFTVGLAIYIFFVQKKGKITSELRSIFYRGLIISLVSSFFLYTPESFKPYRKVLLALNQGDSSISYNVFMMNSIHEAETAIDQDDCDVAITHALKAKEYGRRLIEKTEMEEQNYQTREIIFNELLDEDVETLSLESIKMLLQYEGEEHLYPMNRTFRALFNAYYCKAETLYTEKQYKKALSQYVTAYKYLTTPPIKSVYWQEQKSDILNMIGHCYRQLNKIDLAAYFFMGAFSNYTDATKKTEIDLTSASYLSNVAFLMSFQNGFSESNELFEKINMDLLKEEQTPEHKKTLLNNYQAQTYNYLALDDIEHAFIYVQKAQELVDPTSSNYCSVQYTLAFCQFKANQFKEAEATVMDCLRCFEELSSTSSLKGFEARTLLGQIKFALGQFEEAKEEIISVLNLTATSMGKTNDLYAYNSKILGDIYKILGHYSLANYNYTTALDLYNSGQITQALNIPLVLTGLSDLALLHADFIKAQILIDEAVDGAALMLIPSSPNVAHVYSQAAYVAYHRGHLKTADTLYEKTILIAENYSLSNSLLKANAINGLGLVEMDRKNYNQADKHFQKSLKLYQNIVSDKSPFTAQVYLNYGILNLREGKLAEAKDKLDRSLKINQQFFKADHPTFGDLYVAFGDLAIKKGERDLAQQQYQKALAIYNKYFDSTHWKVRETQQKLK